MAPHSSTPGKSHGQRSLEGCSPWGPWGSDMSERLHFHFSLSCIGEGNGNPLQCSCLENPSPGGAWWAAVYGVTQSWTRLKWLSSSSSSSSITGPHLLNALVPHKLQRTREQDYSFQWRVTCLISVFTPSSLFPLGGEVTYSLTPLGEYHPFYLLLWKNSGQLSSQAEMLVYVHWRPGLVSKLIGKKASPFGYRFKASNEADFFFPVSCVSCLNCLKELSGCSSLSSALTTFGGRRVSDVYSWKDETIQCK